MFNSEHLPGTGESALDFIGDEEDAVQIQNLFDLTEIIERRNDDSAFAQNGFRDECRHVV